MTIQNLSIKVKNAWSVVSCNLEIDLCVNKKMAEEFSTVESSEHIRQSYQLIAYCCGLMKNGGTESLIANFFSKLNEKNHLEKERISDRLHQAVSSYLKDNEKDNDGKFILLERISTKCFLELAPLSYWTSN